MSTVGKIRAWLRAVMLRRRAEREMHEEMNAHIEQAAERFVARGMSEREAVCAARREFGAMSVIQEDARDSRGGRWVDNLTTDARYAFRYFARTPLTTLTIVLTMVLTVRGNAALYSVMHAFLFNPPRGMTDDSALVAIRALERADRLHGPRPLSYA
ncbi:MAG: permease prefix domain 1-containing protein [Gemmatimonas sp.]